MSEEFLDRCLKTHRDLLQLESELRGWMDHMCTAEAGRPWRGVRPARRDG